jgi:hypothetical protein|tara:strand:+ start:894 stop:1286 length:393 start_codon:yes stop_codon:yes gene_type:complete
MVGIKGVSFFRRLAGGIWTFLLIIPMVPMDLLVELYHRVAFPLCKIKLVKRFNYIKIDRHKLSYLNCLEKIGCAYCGYANGLVNYWVKIAAESEKFWCAIKHEKCKDFMVPEHHKEFVDYGDDKGFKKLK